MMKLRFALASLVFLFLGLFSVPSAESAVIGGFPVTLHNGYIWINVSVSGSSNPLHFLLDTGAASSAIDLTVAHHLGLRFGNVEKVKGVGSLCNAYRVSRFKAKASGTTLPDCLLAIDFKAFGVECGPKVDGLLGADFIRDRIIQIDYAAGKVLLLDSIERKPDMQELPVKILNKCLCVPLQIAGRSEQWMRVDTGYDSALEWCSSGLNTRTGHEISVGLSNAPVHYMHTDVKLGRIGFISVDTGVHEHQIFAGEAGLLGNELLSKFKVTLDARHKKLMLEPSGTAK